MCEESTIKETAREFGLDWKAVKELEKEYLREKLKKAGDINPEIIGIDEIAIRKGHRYRIIVSDLLNKRVIWFNGPDRSEESMNLFYNSLSDKKKNIKLVLMDMWKAFYTIQQKKCQAGRYFI